MSEEIEINAKSLVGGIAGGLVASSYALAPTIMNLLGFNPVTSAQIVKYWVYLIVAGGIIALIFSFARVKGSISFSKSSALTSILSFGFVFVISVYILTPLVTPLVYGDTQAKIIEENKNYKVLTLSIPNMVCSGCAGSIQQVLNKAPGIVDAKVTLSNKQAVVIYDPSIATKEKIANLEIFTSIYPATIIKDEDYK
jgi:copper chaperone CopZ